MNGNVLERINLRAICTNDNFSDMTWSVRCNRNTFLEVWADTLNSDCHRRRYLWHFRNSTNKLNGEIYWTITVVCTALWT